MDCIRLTAISALAATLALASGSAVHAAQADDPPAIPTTRSTELNLDAQIMYDSNVSRSDRATAAKRGLALADEIGSPSASLILARPIGRTTYFLKASGGYSFYATNTVRNRDHFDIEPAVATHLGPCQETVWGAYDQAESDLTDLAVGINTNTHEHAAVNLTASCGRPIGFAPSVTVGEAWLNSSATQLRVVDSRTFKVTPALVYQRPTFGAVSVFGEFAETTFPNRLLISPQLTIFTYGYNLYVGGFRYERHLGGRLDLSASVSYTALRPNASNSPAFNGLTYSAVATYAVSCRIILHGALARATVPSNRIQANFSVDETYEGDVSYKFGTRLTLSLTGKSESKDYRLAPGAGPALDLTQQTIYSALGSLTYNLNKHVAVTLDAGDEERQTNFTGLTYSSTRVDLQTRVTF